MNTSPATVALSPTALTELKQKVRARITVLTADTFAPIGEGCSLHLLTSAAVSAPDGDSPVWMFLNRQIRDVEHYEDGMREYAASLGAIAESASPHTHLSASVLLDSLDEIDRLHEHLEALDPGRAIRTADAETFRAFRERASGGSDGGLGRAEVGHTGA